MQLTSTLLVAFAALTTALPADTTPAHSLVQRDDPACGYFIDAYLPNNRNGILGGNRHCYNLKQGSAQPNEQSLYWVYMEGPCLWCDVFYGEGCSGSSNRFTKSRLAFQDPPRFFAQRSEAKSIRC